MSVQRPKCFTPSHRAKALPRLTVPGRVTDCSCRTDTAKSMPHTHTHLHTHTHTHDCKRISTAHPCPSCPGHRTMPRRQQTVDGMDRDLWPETKITKAGNICKLHLGPASAFAAAGAMAPVPERNGCGHSCIRFSTGLRSCLSMLLRTGSLRRGFHAHPSDSTAGLHKFQELACLADKYLKELASCSLGRHVIAGPPDVTELARHSASLPMQCCRCTRTHRLALRPSISGQ